MRKIQKKDSSSLNMLNAAQSLPKLDKFSFDDFKIEPLRFDEEEGNRKHLNINGGDKSPLISKLSFSHDDFPEPFELEHKSSFQSMFLENGHEHSHQHDFTEFNNYIDHPIRFHDHGNEDSPHHDKKEKEFSNLHREDHEFDEEL